jgi:hypothetical protein
MPTPSNGFFSLDCWLKTVSGVDAFGLADGILASLALGLSLVLALLAMAAYRRVRAPKVLWLMFAFLSFAAVGLAWVLDPAPPTWASLSARAIMLMGLFLVYVAVIRP